MPSRDSSAYVSVDDVSDEQAAVLHREALLVLRPSLHRAEIDPEISSAESVAVQKLHGIARTRARWPFSGLRPLTRTGVDLDPAQDDDFGLLLALSSSALLLDAFDVQGRELFSASDAGDLWLRLTSVQYDELDQRLAAHGVPITVLRRMV